MNPPFSSAKAFVCVICEGPEEYDYLNRLMNLDVWNDIYKIKLVNAGGNGNITALYQDKYQNGSYDVVLVFCDTDKKPYDQYIDIKRKIDAFHGKTGVSSKVIIFGNPCTMQIIISHWCKCVLQSSSKKNNAPIIEECTGIKNYDAHDDQRDAMMKLVDIDNYNNMKSNLEHLSDDDTKKGSTNIGLFLERFENTDIRWIERINHYIDCD